MLSYKDIFISEYLYFSDCQPPIQFVTCPNFNSKISLYIIPPLDDGHDTEIDH